ncbi:MAG: ATP-dependent DNA helicase RecG [Chitinophagales bacterium]|nr:ATP-dependent DNA helicase RecG [Chitinophagales bacterium]
MTSFLSTPIEYLKGVGPEKANVLKKELEIFTFGDLIKYFPYKYVDRTKFYAVTEIYDTQTYVQLKGKISGMAYVGNGSSKRLTAKFTDDTGSIELVWFKGFKWLEGAFSPAETYVLYGKPTEFNKKLNFSHPELEPFTTFENKHSGIFRALYNTTEKMKNKSLDSKGIARLLETLFLQVRPEHLPENLPQSIIQAYRLISRYEAIQKIHFPKTIEAQNQAIRRLKFEELFLIQIGMIKNKILKQKGRGIVLGSLGKCFNDFYENYLPFQLTNAQKKVLKEIRKDTLSGHQMNRLLQGDVGSGKTMVALLSLLMVVDSGYQGALMAPTEILAQQHFHEVSRLLQNMDIRVELLTGSTKAKAKKEILLAAENNEIQILIGTHALIEDTVKFANLGMAVIDEQHRFGVAQRAKLWKKNSIPPHVLVMTATPIPRTLAMTLYGDLDVSVLDELPPGRKPVTTVHYSEAHRLRVLGFIKEQIQLGRQIYIVYPLIEESEKSDMKNLMEGFEHISTNFPLPEYRVSVVHGKLKSADKDAEMQRFVKGETHIMVATTVIEVGVNVPNASVMIIENAERFGLSQLHQLRGRVGRGAEQSFCILMTSYKLSQDGKKRIQTMVDTNDGFKIAEVDLQLRGPGELEGTRQSGGYNLKIANLATDTPILEEARKAAILTLEEDPLLQKQENYGLHKYLSEESSDKGIWAKIS